MNPMNIISSTCEYPTW